ncbi:MAG: DUF2062 domain-containing protein [Sulfurimonadaceae bacterium]|nr:DUF2062 domain-containing protein [Sulfurimonadaceae bacterium]
MIRKTLKNTSKHQKLNNLIKKYNIPPEFLSPNRKMVSRAVLLGLFIAFIPMPFQMLAVLAFIPFFRFNVPIALAMCWLTNPLTMPPLYYIEYITGSYLLGSEVAPVHLSVEWFQNNFDTIFIQLYVGASFFSVFGSLLAYWAVNFFWKSSVNKEKNLHYTKRKPK